MTKPLLKQVGDLAIADFKAFPVWVSCHIVDYDEPWYDDTDEETVRPWLGATPVDPAETTFLVAASFRLADGREFKGYLSPASEPDLGAQQPYLAAQGQFFGFWAGMFAFPVEARAAFYSAVAAPAENVFPISFSADPGLAVGVTSGVVEGFYSSPNFNQPPVIER